MPIYEYQCAGCHHEFDVMQKYSDPPPAQCPECSAKKIVRLVSAAGFQLKGTGWYATDFKDKGKPQKKSDASPVTDKSTDKSPEKSADKSKDNSTNKSDTVTKSTETPAPAKPTKGKPD